MNESELNQMRCNCSQCGAEINCGTRKNRVPATRINDRPWCIHCLAKKADMDEKSKNGVYRVQYGRIIPPGMS